MNFKETTKAILESSLEESLEESMLKKFAVGAAIVGSAILPHKPIESNNHEPAVHVVSSELKKEKTTSEPSREDMVNHITSTYKIDDSKAGQIVDAAIKHAHPVFPKAHHLIAVMGVESSFNPTAKSKLKKDPAVGLMQVRPGVHGIDKKEFSTIEGQVKHGASILHQYFKRTNNEDGALHAYNVGITNHVRGKGANPRYVGKVRTELGKFFQQ